MTVVLTEPAAIGQLVQQIVESAKSITDTGDFTSDAERHNLILAAGKLVLATRRPAENIFAIAQQVRT